jgi:hypothetical protein
LEADDGYNWAEEQDKELVRLRRSKPKNSRPRIASRLSVPVDLCKERYQLIKPRGSAPKASKEVRKARKAKKAVKTRPSGMVEFEFDGDIARPSNFSKHMAKDVGSLTDLCNAVIPLLKRSPSVEDSGWDKIKASKRERKSRKA